jgi:putative peptidoglycan lipid II flippase
MAFGVLAGGIAQFVVQLPALHALGFRLRAGWPRFTAEVRRVGLLMLPATVGLAATQLNLLVSTVIASMLEEGSVSWLWYAYRLMQFPIGVFGVALATVSLPALSRAAVAGDMPGLKGTLTASLRLVLVLTVPAAIWLAAANQPIVALLYEHGRFTPFDTGRTGLALVMYCVGLPAFAGVGIVARAFFAMGDTRTPVMVSFVSVALNLVLNVVLMRPLGHAGMALATSATSIVSLLQLLYYLRRRIGPYDLSGTARVLASALAAGAAGGLATWALLVFVGDRWHGGLVREGLVVAGALAIAVAVTWVTLRALRVRELDALEDMVRGLARRVRE